jgi:hypothetical protein
MTTLVRTTGTGRSAVLPAVALVGAPLLIVLGNALHPVIAASSAAALLDAVADSPARWILAKLLYAFGSLLLIPALGSIVRISPRPAVVIGAVLAGIGSGLNAMSQALTGYTAYGVVQLGVDRAAGIRLLEGYDHLGSAGLPVSYAGVPVLLLGLITVGVALLVNRAVPRTAAILLLVGTVAAGLAQAGPLALVAGAPLVAAFVLLARSRISGS